MALSQTKSSLTMDSRKRFKMILKRRQRAVRIGIERLGKKKIMKKKSRGRLELLPAEIRYKIWKYLLINHAVIRCESMYNKDFGYYGLVGAYRSGVADPPSVRGSILRVNRAIWKETSAILYGANEFFAEDLTKAKYEIALKLRKHAPMIKHLIIQVYEPEGPIYWRRTLEERNTDFKEILERLVGLEVLEIGGLRAVGRGDHPKFPDINILRYIIRTTGLVSTFAGDDDSYVRFAVEHAEKRDHEYAFDVSRILRKYHKSVAQKRMETILERREREVELERQRKQVRQVEALEEEHRRRKRALKLAVRQAQG